MKKEKNKMPFWLIVLLTFLFIFILMTIIGYLYNQRNIERNYGCYIYHVQECLYCHSQNLTYLLCSGFCVKPSEQDFDGKGCPVSNPINNCFDLPKECNL